MIAAVSEKPPYQKRPHFYLKCSKIEREEDGGYIAEAETSDGHIFTQADTLDELKNEIRDAVETHFEDQREKMPRVVRLVETEVLELVPA